MTTSPVLAVTATATLTGPTGAIELQLISGSGIVLDEEWSPFAQGTLVAAFSDLSQISAFDPRTRLRVTLRISTTSYQEGTAGDLDLYFAQHGITTAGQFDSHFGAGTTAADIDALFIHSLNPLASNGFGIGAANFDLAVTGITIDPSDGTASIVVQSDEALLRDYKRISTSTLTSSNGNVLDAVNVALAAIGAGPLAGTEIVVEAQQLHTADFENGDLAGWEGGPVTIVTTSTAQHHTGTSALQATAAAPLGNDGVWASRSFPDLAAGRNNVAELWVYTNTARQLRLTFRDPAGGSTGSGSDAAPTSGWRKLTAPIQPATAIGVLELSDLAGAAFGATVYLDDLTVTRSNYVENTAALTVTPTSLSWEPGRSAWEYIAAPLQSVGLRLWADEQRRWRLTRPHEFSRNSIPGYGNIVLNSDDTTSLSVEIDRDDERWFEAAAITYEWTAGDGTQQRQVDVFALEGWTKGYGETINRPFPGAGAAEQLVRRAVGRGRRIPLTAILMPHTYPGDVLVLDNDDVPHQTGYVASVTFDLADGLMTITPRDLETF